MPPLLGPAPSLPKSTLFCWRCGHAGSMDDWCVREPTDGVAYVCPRCETVVTVRGSADG